MKPWEDLEASFERMQNTVLDRFAEKDRLLCMALEELKELHEKVKRRAFNGVKGAEWTDADARRYWEATNAIRKELKW